MEQKGRDATYSEKEKRNRKLWDKLSFDTQLLRAGEDPYPETSHSIRPPIYAAKSFTYPTMDEMIKGHFYYSRTENPTLNALDQKLAVLHKGEKCLSVASGMAAVHISCISVLQKRVERKKRQRLKALLPQNHPEVIPNMIIHKNQYTGSYRLFSKIYPQMGIDFKRIDMRNLNEVKNAIDDQSRILFIESPANPTCDIIDIGECAKLIHEVGGKCIVDNTFASPVLQRPLELGADFVVESLTKYINGHGDCIGGAVIGRENDIRNMRYFWQETEGPVMSPFSAWLILRGVRTLGIRMERHSKNAMKVAQYLDEHPKVRTVIYPGLEKHPGHELAKKQMKDFGGMLGFELETKEMSNKFINLLKLIKVGVSLGDTTSLIEHTGVMTGVDLAGWERRSMDITDTHFRFSVGLEDPDDLILDLEQALNQL